jgi:hypothetical protein
MRELKKRKKVSDLHPDQLFYLVSHSQERTLYEWIDYYNLSFASFWAYVKGNNIKVKGDEY